MTVLEAAEKWLPAGQVLARALRAEDDQSRARLMAMVAFAIRILSAAIAFTAQIVLARLMGEFEYGIFVFVWGAGRARRQLLLPRLPDRPHPLPAAI
jgi:hypothetical protein